jgi:hypothetical protein
MDKQIKLRKKYFIGGKYRTTTLTVPLNTDYEYCIFLDLPLILDVIKLENLRINELQWPLGHRKI